MRMPGFNAETSLLLDRRYLYRGSTSGTQSSGSIQAATGWGYSPVPSYPGQICFNHLVCRWICYGPAPRDCFRFCDYQCLYQIIPLPSVEPGNPVPLP